MIHSAFLLLFLVAAARAEQAPPVVAAELHGPTRRIPIVVGLFTEAAKFHPSGFHPGVVVGTEIPWAARRGHLFFQTANLGYWYHADLAHALLLQTELGYRHTFRAGFLVDVLLGFAYLHSFYPGTSYGLDGGRYRVDNGGAPAFFPTLTLGVGWDLGQLERGLPFSVFARYQLGVEVPGPYGVPAYPHTQVIVGARVPLARFGR